MKFVRLAVALCVGLAPACNKSAAPVPPATPPTATAGPLAAVPGVPPTPPPPASDAAAKFGAEFLTAVQAGKASAAQLTPEFKKLVAPSATAPDWAAGHWLDELKGVGGAGDVTKLTWQSLDASATLGVARGSGKGVALPWTLCKVVKSPGGTGFLVDWIHVSPAREPVDFTTDTAAKFVAVAFVDTLLTKQTPLAVSLVAPATLKRLAPPLDADDAKLGYNRGILGIKLDGFRESFASVTFGAATKAGGNLTLSGELTGPGTERRKFAVTVAPAGSGWLVEDFRHD